MDCCRIGDLTNMYMFLRVYEQTLNCLHEHDEVTLEWEGGNTPASWEEAEMWIVNCGTFLENKRGGGKTFVSYRPLIHHQACEDS